jgi:hypothetical protein
LLAPLESGLAFNVVKPLLLIDSHGSHEVLSQVIVQPIEVLERTLRLFLLRLLLRHEEGHNTEKCTQEGEILEGLLRNEIVIEFGRGCRVLIEKENKECQEGQREGFLLLEQVFAEVVPQKAEDILRRWLIPR